MDRKRVCGEKVNEDRYEDLDLVIPFYFLELCKGF